MGEIFWREKYETQRQDQLLCYKFMELNLNWRKVICTHEEEQQLSSGPWLGDNFPGIALPSVKSLKTWVILRYKGITTIGQCVDVGPWCIDDDDYVFDGKKPRAEKYQGRYCPLKKGSTDLATVPDGNGGMREVAICNGAGIDIFPRVAKELQIPIGNNVVLEWAFTVN